jgi:hypothetical protein
MKPSVAVLTEGQHQRDANQNRDPEISYEQKVAFIGRDRGKTGKVRPWRLRRRRSNPPV